LSDGGGIFANSTKSKLENSVIAGNHATTYGGGVYGLFESITNVTIVGNIAEKAGGGWYMPSSTVAASVLANSILAYNVAKGTSSTYGGQEIRTYTKDKLIVSYSLIRDQDPGNGKGYTSSSNNNLAAMTDPKFVGFGTSPTPEVNASTSWSSTLWRNWNLQLVAGSPAIDAGNNAVVTEIYDVRGYGYDRINNGTVDMGAYEFGSVPAAPSPPANVSTNAMGDAVTVTWSAVTGATRYSIVRHNPDGSTASEIFVNAPQLSYNDTNVSSGTYTYDVYSWIDTVKSQTANSDSVAIIPVDPILPSPKVTAIPSNDTAILTWSAVTGADYYRVYQWDNVTHSLGTLLEDNITQLTWSQSGLVDGTYWYAVLAVNSTTVSDVNPVEVVIGGLASPVVTGTNPSEGTVQLVWAAIDGATHYTVSLLDSNNETLLDANVTGTIWTDSNLSAGIYRYAVRAVDSNTGSSSGFNSVTVTVDSYSETLQAPNVTINVLDNDDVQITWSSVPTATHYEIQRRLFGNDTWDVLVAQWSGTTFVDTTAPEGNVEYAVRAVKGTTVSEPGVGSAFINRPPAAPVVTLSFNDQQKTVTVSWNTVPTADTYDVRRRVGGGEWVLLTDQYANTSFIDTNVPEGYVEYSVRAYEGIANVSNYIVQGITIDLPPAAPVVTTTIQSTSETVKLTWNAISTAVYYSIERRMIGGTWETLSDEWDSTVFVDTDVPEGNVEYAVRAYESTELVSGFNSVEIFVDWTVPAPDVTTSVDDSGVTLTWATVPTATYYDVRRRTVGGTWTTLSEQWTSTTFADSTAPEGIFEYSVRAYDGTTVSPFNGVLVEVDLPPAAPTVTVTIQPNEKVKLTWNAISMAVYYSIERRVDSGDWETLSDEWDSTIFIDSDVPEGDVEYAVRAYEESGLVSGFDSVDVLVDWAPATPNVTASVSSNGNVTLTWSAVYTATSYEVRRREVGGSWATLTDQLGATAFVDTTAPEGNIEYSVRAFDGTILSGFTAVGVFVDAPPAAPTLTATLQSNGTVQLSWNTVTGAQSYELVRQSAGSTTLEVLVSQWYGTSFVDAAPADGNVVYLVRALEGTTYSAYGSASVYITPPAIVISNSSVTATTLSDQTVYLEWDAATNATGYNVFSRVAGTTNWTQVNSQPLTDTEFVDTAPSLGSVEYYVTAIRGTNTSGFNTTTATVGLAAPVVTADVETSGEVTITWDAVNNAARYSVWVKVAGGTWTQLSNNVTGESFVHTNPTVGTVQYAVKAHNGAVVSGFVAVTVNVPSPSSGTTTLPPFGAPVVNATLEANGTVSITWGEVEDATRYTVWYQEAGGGWVQLSNNATGGSFVHTNPPSGTVKYTVKAHNTVASSFVAVTLLIP
jgi:fibronectin type 3 domain-containing protein